MTNPFKIADVSHVYRETADISHVYKETADVSHFYRETADISHVYRGETAALDTLHNVPRTVKAPRVRLSEAEKEENS